MPENDSHDIKPNLVSNHRDTMVVSSAANYSWHLRFNHFPPSIPFNVDAYGLLMYFCSLYSKQYGPRTDCSRKEQSDQVLYCLLP